MDKILDMSKLFPNYLLFFLLDYKTKILLLVNWVWNEKNLNQLILVL